MLHLLYDLPFTLILIALILRCTVLLYFSYHADVLTIFIFEIYHICICLYVPTSNI